jgi:tRNA wybutosine-synthesizing protein 2
VTVKLNKKTPFQEIKEKLNDSIPPDLSLYLPKKWEKIGNILILKIPKELKNFSKKIAKVYAEVLDCKTVLEDIGGISGEYRKPIVRLVYGDQNCETIHIENGIRYKLDASKIMFSSGNMDERIRMATISNSKETVVDLFAGIGYFSIPMAAYSKPKKIYACEKNPLAYKYLCENIALNHVTDIVEPLFGDNREVAPCNVADRAVMGYVKDTHNYLQTAIGSLKDKCGIIHYHEACPNELLPERPFSKIKNIASENNRIAKLIEFKKIKSYAPGVTHVVLDVKIMK